METAEFELGYLASAIPVLENYLLAEDIYWSLAAIPSVGASAYPNLTLGTLYLMLRKLEARRLPPQQQVELERLKGQIEQLRSRWRSVWEKKAGREFGARLTLWRNYMEDYRNDPENHADRYAYEINRRVMLALLEDETEPEDAELEMLRGLDSILRAYFVPGEFTWEAELASGFPRDKFWYLYGHLRSERI
jgi:hypothetical protein